MLFMFFSIEPSLNIIIIGNILFLAYRMVDQVPDRNCSSLVSGNATNMLLLSTIS